MDGDRDAGSAEPRSLAQTLYAKAMGVGKQRLSQGPGSAVSVRTSDVIYYAYKRGLFPALRGLWWRHRLRYSGGRLFVGKSCRILFPRHLSVGHNVALGDHLYINCYGSTGVRLGNNVRIKEFGWVQVTSQLSNPGVGLTIEDDTYVGPHCVLGAGGGISVGRSVTIGAYVHLLAEQHRFQEPGRPIGEQGVSREGIRIGNGTWLGNASIVLDGVAIGENAVVGAGAVVTRDVPAWSVVAGNPARIIRRLDH